MEAGIEYGAAMLPSLRVRISNQALAHEAFAERISDDPHKLGLFWRILDNKEFSDGISVCSENGDLSNEVKLERVTVEPLPDN
jgi:hypothetical protein